MYMASTRGGRGYVRKAGAAMRLWAVEGFRDGAAQGRGWRGAAIGNPERPAAAVSPNAEGGRGTSRREVREAEQLAHVRRAVAVDVVVVRRRNRVGINAIEAGDVAMVVLRLRRSADAAGEGLRRPVVVEIGIEVADALAVLLDVEHQRADELRRGHRGADHAVVAAVIAGDRRAAVGPARRLRDTAGTSADLHADVGDRAEGGAAVDRRLVGWRGEDHADAAAGAPIAARHLRSVAVAVDVIRDQRVAIAVLAEVGRVERSLGVVGDQVAAADGSHESRIGRRRHAGDEGAVLSIDVIAGARTFEAAIVAGAGDEGDPLHVALLEQVFIGLQYICVIDAIIIGGGIAELAPAKR